MQLSQENALNLAIEKLQKSGATTENAIPLAKGIIDAENQGIKSHGFHYLPIYCLHLSCGKVKGDALPSLQQISNSAFKVNADNGFAHRAIDFAFKEIINSAKQNGIASAGISNSYNCGVLGYHTRCLAEQGLVGIGFTNAPASIAPLGGIKAVVGTNPFSIAVPVDGKVKLIVDQSASVIAKSEISVRAKTNEPIPEGWAYGPDGKFTTDANEALKGTMAPSGGYKGFGVGLLVEIMAACLGGGNLGTQASSFANDVGGPPATGQFFMAFNPSMFNKNFNTQINQLLNSIEEQEGARIPGSSRISNFDKNKEAAINIKDTLFETISKI
ncbi:MAG: sulfolactate dehydrogenase [Pelagibacteraceae bacterium]|nr:sulfolactate dehydrogenase [Pelagibacteraceae bacterium]